MTSDLQTPAATEQDASLVQRGRIGDQDALNALVRRHWRTAYKRAFRILHSHEDAEDVAQEALLAAVTHLDDYSEQATFSTWLQRIVINRTLMLLRARRSSPMHLAAEFCEERYAAPHTQSDPERSVIASEHQHMINAALNRLPDVYREPLWRFTYGQESIIEIAQQLGVPGGTIKIRLHRARKQLSQKAVHKFFIVRSLT